MLIKLFSINRDLMVAQSVVQFTISTEKTQLFDFKGFWK